MKCNTVSWLCLYHTKKNKFQEEIKNFCQLPWWTVTHLEQKQVKMIIPEQNKKIWTILSSQTLHGIRTIGNMQLWKTQVNQQCSQPQCVQMNTTTWIFSIKSAKLSYGFHITHSPDGLSPLFVRQTLINVRFNKIIMRAFVK